MENLESNNQLSSLVAIIARKLSFQDLDSSVNVKDCKNSKLNTDVRNLYLGSLDTLM